MMLYNNCEVNTLPNNENTKTKPIYLMKILLEKTDEDHPMSITDIIEELAKLNISAERKSLYSDIKLLKLFGLDVETYRSKTVGYYVASRDFELPELKLLVAAVQSSRFITSRKSAVLIDKLCKLTSEHEATKLQKYASVENRIKTTNESIFYSIDAIHGAINDNRKISFKYNEYTIGKTKKLRRNGEPYTISPYAMTWSNENYYLIGYYDRHNKISHFRVDRISDVLIIDEPRVDEANTFDVDEYIKSVFDMYGAEITTVQLQFANSLINVAIDRFGEAVIINKKDMDSFTISVEVAVSPTFFGWVFQFCGKVKILSPESIKFEYEDMMKNT